jgi:hypothetical protein
VASASVASASVASTGPAAGLTGLGSRVPAAAGGAPVLAA